jgi:hypothetical protein
VNDVAEPTVIRLRLRLRTDSSSIDLVPHSTRGEGTHHLAGVEVVRKAQAKSNKSPSVQSGGDFFALNLRLLGEIGTDTFGGKSLELRDREARLNLEIEACGRGRHENADIAVKAFELSQALSEQWITADLAAKRRFLEILVLNLLLDGATLVPEWRKPFDFLAKGLSVQQSRGDRRWTFPNDPVSLRLFWSAIAQTMEFSADTFFALGS